MTPDLTGWEVLAHLRRLAYEGPVVALIDSLEDLRAQQFGHQPGVRCIVRPQIPDALDNLLTRLLLEHLVRAGDPPAPAGMRAYGGIVGQAPQMLEIFERIERLAGSSVNVCVYGESGTGKELVARAIHYASPRRDRPLITLDCTTVPEGLMESHLLGHVKGAFTGAVEHREGVFSLAHTGTLFIDELCELAIPLQAKLLRVIQSREFVKVGGTKPIRTDVRLITATNKDLREEVARGRFREDLYYRVAVFVLRVPPLRERKEDIPLLVEHFLRKFSASYGKSVSGVERIAMDRLLALHWPGNVRQLENVIEQAVVLADRDCLTEEDLFPGEDWLGPSEVRPSGEFQPGLTLGEVERLYVLRTLHRVNGNRTEAARLLGISVRGLQYKLKAYRGMAEGPRGLAV